MGTIVQEGLTDEQIKKIERDVFVRADLREEGYDLPELADTMEEADARAAASKYLRAMRAVSGEADANEAEFKVLVAYDKARHEERQGKLGQRVAYLFGQVERLFAFMHVPGKKKSLTLIGGNVGKRGQQDELVIEDEDAVIAYAKLHQIGDLIQTKETVNRKTLRAHFKALTPAERADPTLSPPGTSLKARPDKFFATPATD